MFVLQIVASGQTGLMSAFDQLLKVVGDCLRR